MRSHYDYKDDFIRVSFLTEDHQKGQYSGVGHNESLLNHIQNLMRNGFKIGRKNFKFLHYSNSQLKSHSCWFMNETGYLSYDSLIDTLGNFSKETLVSKNASRRGQAFSSAVTTETLRIGTEIKELDDITRDGYIFTDG